MEDLPQNEMSKSVFDKQTHYVYLIGCDSFQ